MNTKERIVWVLKIVMILMLFVAFFASQSFLLKKEELREISSQKTQITANFKPSK